MEESLAHHYQYDSQTESDEEGDCDVPWGALEEAEGGASSCDDEAIETSTRNTIRYYSLSFSFYQKK